MRSLPIIKATLEKELALFPQLLSEQISDDALVRLSSEEELLRRLLALTDQFIQEQASLEQHIEAYV